MFKALFGSLIGRITSLALLVVGLTGGMAATGELPTFTVAAFGPPAAVQAAPSAGIALDFPTSILVQPVAAPAPVEVAAPVEVIVEEAPPVSVTAAAPAAPPKCVGQLQGLVTGLVNGIQAITSPEQAQALLAQAGSLGQSAVGCATEATAAGNLGLDQLGKTTEQLIAAVVQIQALPILAGTPGTAANPLGEVTELVGVGLVKTVGVVNKGLNLLLSPLN